MKVFALNKILYPILTIAALSVPLKTAQEEAVKYAHVSVNTIPKSNEITLKDLEGLKITSTTNFAGGVNHHFDSESVQKLKERIYKPDSLLAYRAPIENSANVYLEPFGADPIRDSEQHSVSNAHSIST